MLRICPCYLYRSEGAFAAIDAPYLRRVQVPSRPSRRAGLAARTGCREESLLLSQQEILRFAHDDILLLFLPDRAGPRHRCDDIKG